MSQSDEFSGRMGLIFAAIGAAIGTGNIWRFPRMVGANEGGTFLIPWLFFLFAWSIPLVIAEFALGKRSRTGTIGTFRIFAGKNFAWMGLWTAWISTAIGFYYAVVAGWCLKYFQLGFSNGLTGENVDTQQVWNEFLLSPGTVILFQFLVIAITLLAIWKGAKAIEKVNVVLMVSLFVLLFMSLGLSLYMDMEDGSLDGFLFMFTVKWSSLSDPAIWINGLSQSAWSCSAGMGMAITYSVYMRKDEDTTLNAFTMGLANNSISIIAGLTVLSAIFAVSENPLDTVTNGSSAITFLALPEVFAQAPGGSIGAWVMMTGFFLALSFAALTSMISTVELCVRNFVDHGYEREKSVLLTSIAIFIFGLPSALLWVTTSKEYSPDGTALPLFLEVQDHIWGYGLMFSGLFIAFTIWKYGYSKWQAQVEAGEAAPGLKGYLGVGVSAFRDDFINTGDNDIWIGRWWDVLLYLAFPFLFSVLIISYFGDMIASGGAEVWDPSNPKGVTIILLFWGIVAGGFIIFNRALVQRPLFRNVPEGAEVDISMLPGGSDDLVMTVGDTPENWSNELDPKLKPKLIIGTLLLSIVLAMMAQFGNSWLSESEGDFSVNVGLSDVEISDDDETATISLDEFPGWDDYDSAGGTGSVILWIAVAFASLSILLTILHHFTSIEVPKLNDNYIDIACLVSGFVMMISVIVWYTLLPDDTEFSDIGSTAIIAMIAGLFSMLAAGIGRFIDYSSVETVES